MSEPETTAAHTRDVNLSRQRDGTWLLEIPPVRLTLGLPSREDAS